MKALLWCSALQQLMVKRLERTFYVYRKLTHLFSNFRDFQILFSLSLSLTHTHTHCSLVFLSTLSETFFFSVNCDKLWVFEMIITIRLQYFQTQLPSELVQKRMNNALSTKRIQNYIYIIIAWEIDKIIIYRWENNFKWYPRVKYIMSLSQWSRCILMYKWLTTEFRSQEFFFFGFWKFYVTSRYN